MPVHDGQFPPSEPFNATRTRGIIVILFPTLAAERIRKKIHFSAMKTSFAKAQFFSCIRNFPISLN